MLRSAARIGPLGRLGLGPWSLHDVRSPDYNKGVRRSPAIAAAAVIWLPAVALAESWLPAVSRETLDRQSVPAVPAPVEVKERPILLAQAPQDPSCRFSAEIPSGIGAYTRESLIAMAKTVFGEASMDENEQCAVVLTIANRSREWDASVPQVCRDPGQFHGYSPYDRRSDCEKLRASAEVVRSFAKTGSCSFGKPEFLYFCASWGLPKSKRGKARIIGETAFLSDGPC